jgi:signal transduction histidine kinase
LDGNAFHDIQAEQTVRAVPLLVFFHGCASFCIHLAVDGTASSLLRNGWVAVTLLSGFPFIAIYVAWRQGYFKDRTALAHNLLELSGLLFAVAWALPTAIYATSEQVKHLLPVMLISLSMMGITVLALLRIPVAAIVFAALLTAALSRSAYLAMADYKLVAAFVVAVYGATLIGVSMISHSSFLQRMRTETELRQQKDFINLLLADFDNGSQDWIWETDRKGLITYASRRLAEFLGEDEASLPGKSFRVLLAGVAEAQSWEEFEAAFSGDGDINPLMLKSRDGIASILITARAKRSATGAFDGWRGMGRDVSAVVAAEARAKAALTAVEATSAAKSRFLSIVSHELRTPIHAIVGYSDLLARDPEATRSSKSLKEFCDAIQSNARLLQGLINDILDATRLERGSLRLVEQDIDAAELAESAIRECRAAAEASNVTIIGKLADGVSLNGDLARLKQAICNVLSNAIKFSPEGGIVHIEMLRAGSGLVFQIRDAGGGIAAEDIPRMFEPFGQLDDSLSRPHGGLGLGLAIARRVFQLHNGDATLVSVLGGGTTISLSLPGARVSWPETQAELLDKKSA